MLPQIVGAHPPKFVTNSRDIEVHLNHIHNSDELGPSSSELFASECLAETTPDGIHKLCS